jgi:hypothetical protein
MAFRSWRMIGRAVARQATTLESRARERSGGAGKDIRCALRCACVNWISFERRRPRALFGLQRDFAVSADERQRS